MNNIVLDNIQQFNLNLILNKSYYPLTGFMNQKDYLSVIDYNHLFYGDFFPFPIVLQINLYSYNNISKEKKVYLVDEYNKRLAILDIEDIYKPDIDKEYKIYSEKFIPYFYKFGINEEYYHIGGKVTKYIDKYNIKLSNKYLDRYLEPNNIIKKNNKCLTLDNKIQLKEDIDIEDIHIIFSYIYPFVSNKNKYIQYKKHYNDKTIYIDFPYEEEDIIDKNRINFLKELVIKNYKC